VPDLFLSYARMAALRKSLHILVLLWVTSPELGETLIDGLRADDRGRYAEAESVWGRLAQAENMDAQTALAEVYISAPPGITYFAAKAASLYRQAAEQGEPIAQRNLGDFYDKDVGVSTDLAKAAFWIERAANKDYDWAAERLRQLESKFTKVDRAEVVRLTTEWRTLHPR
jgi:TPR repeat protein